MDVYDFLNLLTEDGESVEIYDLSTDKVVAKDTARDLRFSEYADYEVMSIDVNPLCINIETESDCEYSDDVSECGYNPYAGAYDYDC